MAWTAFEIAVNFYQSFLCMYFLKHCVQINRPSLWKDALCFFSVAGFLTLYLFFDVPISDVAGALFHFVWLMSVSDDPWYVKAFWITIKEIIIVSIAGIVTHVFMLIVPDHDMLMVPGFIRFLFVFTATLAFFIVFFTIAQLKSRKHIQSYSVLAIFFFLNLSILVAMEILFALQIQDVFESSLPFFVAYAVLITGSILSVVLFFLMSHTAQKQREMELSLNHARLTRQHQQALTDMYKDFIARQHDFKHQLQALEQLVKEGNAQAAQMHLDAYRNHLPDHDGIITGCLAADALLTAKRIECEHQQIDFHLSFDPLSRLPIDEVAFCSVIGNLLDNAIEGALRLPHEADQRWIRLSLHRIQDMFIICCQNSMLPASIQQKEGVFLSAKPSDKIAHGYGISNIQSIVHQADGFSSFEIEGHVFSASVTLPYAMIQ
ncbi:MAG: GHKL domain-containing protein [Clostridia bacterium]|nr:GHKL domain-containing protein [Clostridia bacterium]